MTRKNSMQMWLPQPCLCIICMLVMCGLLTSFNTNITSLDTMTSPVDTTSLSSDFNYWIDYCWNTTGWIVQDETTEFNSPIRVIEEGDLIVGQSGLFFNNLPVPGLNNTGPLAIKDIGVSLPLHSIRFLWVSMIYDYSLTTYGGLTVLLFDSDKKVAASFNLIDEWSETPIAMSICYYPPRTTIPLAEHYYETTSTNPEPEFTLFYVDGSGNLACVTFLDTRQSIDLVQHGDYNTSREIRYIGLQGICAYHGYDQEEFYQLNEIQIIYEDPFVDATTTTTTVDWGTIDYTTTYETPDYSTSTDDQNPSEPNNLDEQLPLVTIVARSISIGSLLVIAVVVGKTIQRKVSFKNEL